MRQKKKGSHMVHRLNIGGGLMCILMVCAFLVPAKQALAAGNTGKEQTITHFKEQITGDSAATAMYEAMESLYVSGEIMTGKGSIEITDKLPEGALAGYVKGKTDLPRAFQAARDAFIQDYPDLFYVDATKLTLRVGQKGENQFIALINNGSNENYYADGFGKVSEVETALVETEKIKTSIIQAANEKTSVKDKVIVVHDELVKRIAYTYPTGTDRSVAGIYGALVGGKANCEGYSRAFKWIMDEMGVPCLLVQGSATNSNNLTEEHMWNYVQIEGKWFGVDVTWDDPMQATKKEKADEIRTKYLLVGSDVLDADHFASGVFSNGSKSFTYPSLCQIDYSVYMSSDIEDVDNELQITVEKAEENDVTVSRYSIYYKGMTLNEIKEKGLSLAARIGYKEDNGVFQPWVDLDAYNVEPRISPMVLPIGKEGSIQFCITKEKLPEGKLHYIKDLSEDGNYEAGALTKILKVPYFNNYVAPPFIRKSTPELTARILPEQQHYRVEYDQLLVREDETKEPGINVWTSQPHLKYAVTNVKTEETSFTLPNGKERKSTVIEFDFMPDTSFQGYVNTYALQPTNLVDASTKKRPNAIPIVTTFQPSVPCPIFASQGGNNNAFVLAYPTLVANDRMDIFEADSGYEPTGMEIRLVASIPNAIEEGKMLDALDDKENILSSASYDLSLGCQNVTGRLAQADYHLTIGVPYPDGFNYNDNQNVTFKAYHYVKQPDGSYKEEELACRITERGLEIIAESFSPFTVVALPKEEEESGYKLVSITTDTQGGVVKTALGGKDVVAEGLYKLDDTTTERTFKIQADTGYEIDKLYIDGVLQEVKSGTESLEANFTYKQLKTRAVANANENENTLKVSFIAKQVKTEEEKKNYTPVTPEVKVEVPELKSISVADERVRKVYTEGEVFNPTGLVVTGHYSDGATKSLEKYTVTDAPLMVGTEKVAVTFSKGETKFQAEITGITVNPRPSEKKLTGINITAQPSKLRYKMGEKFDGTGMKVEAEYLNGEKSEIQGYTIVDADKELTEKDKQVIVSYTEEGETRDAKVDIAVTAADVNLTAIELDGTPRTMYFEGETFSMKGAVVVAVYSDGSKSKLDAAEYQITPSEALSKDNKQVTISYQEGENKKEIVVEIKVKENTLEAIEIAKAPDKTTYYGGETFDKTGMIVNAVYADKSKKEITDYTITPQEPLNKNSVITVSYEGKEVIVKDIKVYELKSIAIQNDGPTKKIYYNGEMFDRSGMKVIATYDDGSTRQIADYKVEPAELSAGSAVILSYADKRVPVDGIEIRKLVDIKITQDPTKTQYAYGETFNPEGMVVEATYNGGKRSATEEITDYSWEWNGALTEADTTVTIIASKGKDVIEKVYDKISVDSPDPNKEITNIKLLKGPNKTNYGVGEIFDPNGISANVEYIDGTTEEIKSGFRYHGKPLTLDDTKMSISYLGKEVTDVNDELGITVTELTGISVTTPPKTKYVAGDEFNPEGMVVTAIYKNEKRTIEFSTAVEKGEYTNTPVARTKLTKEDTAVTVSFTSGLKTYAAVIPITVTEPKPEPKPEPGEPDPGVPDPVPPTPENPEPVPPTPENPPQPGTDIKPEMKPEVKPTPMPNKNGTASVKTGDTQNIALYVVLLLSMAAIIVISIKRKKDKEI